jgi:hydroxymethylpyrimidine pyrophosphatase-like HAD family hydrolase
MTRAIVLVDLDDTLFQTLRKRPEDVPESALTVMATARDGSPLGFATPRQLGFLQWLSHEALLIPVTARSLDALRRVRIPYAQAICAHGAVLIDADGRVDPEWSAAIASAAAAWADALSRLADLARTAAAEKGVDLQIRIQVEEGVDLYLLMKHPDANEAALARAVDVVARQTPPGWTVHRNGNNAAFLPPFLGKQHAVARLLPRLRAAWPDAPVIGVGDSLTDAPFMALCDFAMTPCGSQLAANLLGGGR